jgi:hypothetical protein
MKVLFLLLALFTLQLFNQPVFAATSPSSTANEYVSSTAIQPVVATKKRISIIKVYKSLAGNRKLSLREKLMLRILEWKAKWNAGALDEPTAKQKKLGRLSFILALAAVLFLVFPYAALAISSIFGIAAVPLAIAGLILGIKSVEGNTNALGLIGLILSATLLLVMILVVVFLAIFFSEGWF